MRFNSVFVLTIGLLCLVTTGAGCASEASAPAGTSSPGIAISPTVAQETPLHAARRLFPEVYRSLLNETERPHVLRGVSVAAPWPVSRDYDAPGPTVATWALPQDVNTVTTGMFAAMQEIPTSDDFCLVPMAKDGRSVCEFEISRSDKGRWHVRGMLEGPLPGGSIYDAESATAKLQDELGAGAEIRFVVFQPSGLIFAVGSNGEREAAVYLTFNNAGPAITGFDKYLPRTGRLFTPAELSELLTP